MPVDVLRRDISPAAKLVFAALAAEMYDRKTVEMTHAEIEACCHVAARHVKRSIKVLVAQGLVEQRRLSAGRVHQYRLLHAEFAGRSNPQPPVAETSIETPAAMLTCAKCHLPRRRLHRSGPCRGCKADLDFYIRVRALRVELGPESTPRSDRRALLNAARFAIHSVNKVVPLANVATLDELVQASISGQRIRTAMLSLVAGAALFLAALGLYGVLAYSVVQRSTEIGIRMALGASAPQLFRMILLDGMGPVIVGATFGFAAAYAASSLIRSLLFNTVPADPPTYLLTVLILAAVSLFACAIPAMKAIQVDPVVSLRRQ